MAIKYFGYIFVLSMIWILSFLLIPSGILNGCTNYLISKGASEDGSTMISYSADSHELYGELYYTPSTKHVEGSLRNIYEWDTGKFLGSIKQISNTYAVMGMMNEYQLSIGETTFGGRKELIDPKAIMDYGSLMFVALERAKTAQEAIKIMTDLVAEYGYYSSGESFSIADPQEVWLLEMISKGPNNKGAVWVARLVPDGYVCAHANQARIRNFPLKDPKKCIYSKDVISFAREKGYFEGNDEDFSFADAYAPLDFGALRFCEARVWSMFRRVVKNPEYMDQYLEYVKGDIHAEPLPLWIRPSKKLSLHQVMELMRDHFEGTPLDMTKDLGAGPFCLPYRWRPLTWTVEKDEKKLKEKITKYCNERAVSTQQTGFSFISQARSWLPNAIGGVHWFGVDDTYSTVYIPIYCGNREVPKAFAVGTGSFYRFSWESAWWVFNFVANFAYSRYSDMIKDIQLIQREIEGNFLAAQSSIEKTALHYYQQSPEIARNFLTQYSIKNGNYVIKKWKKLGEFLLFKYLDGNLKVIENEKINVTHPGYPKEWYQKIISESHDHFKIIENQKEETH